jgi:hypothetical protein
MPALALLMRPTETGWAVYLSDGQELIRYRGPCAKQLASRYLQRYTRSVTTPQRPTRSWWRELIERW